MELIKDLVGKDVSTRQPSARVLGFSGSPRKKGNSDAILREIAAGVTDANLPANGIALRDVQFQPCIGCERCRRDKICTGLTDGMSVVYPEIIASKGLILVCPTHNYNVTAWMKAFIDRLYCFYNFENTRPRGWSSNLAGQGRKVVLAAVCEQVGKEDMGFTMDAMRRPIEALGYDVIGELPVYGIFDRGKVKDSADVMTSARRLGADLAAAITA